MCIIIVCESQEISLSDLKEAERTNQDGAGIGWIDKKGRVKWSKGLTAEKVFEVQKRIKSFPYVIHFRLSTSGGYDKGLNHPFPITKEVKTSLKGSADKILFHNGHVYNWQEKCLTAMLRHKIPFLEGDVSDTRSFAWLAYHFGEKILSLLKEKIVVLSKTGADFYGEGWVERDGKTYSNSLLIPYEYENLKDSRVKDMEKYWKDYDETKDEDKTFKSSYDSEASVFKDHETKRQLKSLFGGDADKYANYKSDAAVAKQMEDDYAEWMNHGT